MSPYSGLPYFQCTRKLDTKQERQRCSIWQSQSTKMFVCVCVLGESERAREGERGLIRIKSNLAKTSNPQYRSFRAVRLLCKETARQRLTDLSLKPFYLMVAYSPGIQYAFMHDSSGNNLNYYSGRNHFRNTALWITFCLILLIPPSRFRLISSHREQLIWKLILCPMSSSHPLSLLHFFPLLLYFSKMWTLLRDSIMGRRRTTHRKINRMNLSICRFSRFSVERHF